MTITYPQDWASDQGYTRDRLEITTAIAFVNSIQSFQFGNMIEMHNQHIEENRDPNTDPVYNTEQDLQSHLDDVINWLHKLEDNGQQTISRDKAIKKIETHTGYEFRFS